MRLAPPEESGFMTKCKLELSPRLQLLADWVRPGTVLADVGTDHGYLPVWLVENDRIPFAIASDLRPGPLSRGRETAAVYGVSDRVDFRLCDGLAGIAPTEADTIVIAGMGGETIASILSSAPWTADGTHTLLLQPMTRSEELRRYLLMNGYAIRREQLVEDRGMLYPVMEATAGKMKLSSGQIYAGTMLPTDPLGDRYLIEKIIRLQTAVTGLKRSSVKADLQKADRLRELIFALMELREEWRHANSPGN